MKPLEVGAVKPGSVEHCASNHCAPLTGPQVRVAVVPPRKAGSHASEGGGRFTASAAPRAVVPSVFEVLVKVMSAACWPGSVCGAVTVAVTVALAPCASVPLVAENVSQSAGVETVHARTPVPELVTV